MFKNSSLFGKSFSSIKTVVEERGLVKDYLEFSVLFKCLQAN